MWQGTATTRYFYRALSRGMYGHEENHHIIRLLTALEIADHPENYDPTASNYVDLIKDVRIVTSPYQDLLRESATMGHYAETAHMIAASSALKLAFKSYCPPTANYEFLSDPLTRRIRGRGVGLVSEPAFVIMWTQTTVPHPNRCSSFKPNHFVLLVQREQHEEHVDLMTPTKETAAEPDWPPLSPPASPVAPGTIIVNTCTVLLI